MTQTSRRAHRRRRPAAAGGAGGSYFGGWWLFGVGASRAILALHELSIDDPAAAAARARRLRRGRRGLLGAQLGGTEWLLAGLLAIFVFAFVLYGIAGDAPVRRR